MSAHRANLDAALALAAHGIYVFPALATWNETTQKLDKKPAISEWQAKAATDVAQISQWWTTFPAAIPGIELARSNLFVLDLDRHPGGADGIAAFRAFRGSKLVPQCPTVETPSGGYHLYFRQPAGEPLGNRTGTLPGGVDCRGAGGWTVAPGAVFGPWQWVGTAEFAAAPPVPDWIVSAIQAPKATAYSPSPSPSHVGRRERCWAEAALRDEARKLSGVERGRRNATLNTTAFRLGTMVARSWVGQHIVEGALLDACVSNGLAKDDGRPAVLATIRSGLEAGLKQPHADLQDRNKERAGPAREPEPVGADDWTLSQGGTTWRDGLITARFLQTKTFAPVRMIVPGLIPEGVTIFAGKPKIGKSWLALDVCAAVAGTRFVLGDTKPAQGDALYLALEDNQRRLKKRTDKILQGAVGSERFEMHTEWRRLDQGGLDDIREWCEAHSAPRLIWIDTFAKIRPVAGKNEQAYGYDYRAVEGLQKLAGEYQVGIVLNHHLRKMSSEEDAFDDVSGTLGLTGAADTIIVMKRQAGMVKIYVRGRDIEEAEFAAEFNRDTCRWRLVGEAEEVFRSQQRQAIAAALNETARSMSVADIMAATERRDRHSTEVLLHKMEKAGEAKHVGRGRWAHPAREAGPTQSDEIGEIGEKVGRIGKQAIDGSEENRAGKPHHQSQRNLNASKTVEIRDEIPENANPLMSKEKKDNLTNLNDLNDSYRSDGSSAPNGGNGVRPTRNDGHLVRDLPAKTSGGQVGTRREIRLPALGPAGDSLEDLK